MYAIEILVRISSEDTVNVMDAPCVVVPVHWPTLSDDEEAEGAAGALLHPDASSPASIPTDSTAFVRLRTAADLRVAHGRTGERRLQALLHTMC